LKTGNRVGIISNARPKPKYTKEERKLWKRLKELQRRIALGDNSAWEEYTKLASSPEVEKLI
jgi:hypothetical protein